MQLAVQRTSTTRSICKLTIPYSIVVLPELVEIVWIRTYVRKHVLTHFRCIRQTYGFLCLLRLRAALSIKSGGVSNIPPVTLRLVSTAFRAVPYTARIMWHDYSQISDVYTKAWTRCSISLFIICVSKYQVHLGAELSSGGCIRI